MHLNHNLQSLPKSKTHREGVTSDCTQKTGNTNIIKDDDEDDKTAHTSFR